MTHDEPIDDMLAGLTPPQREAVTWGDGPLLVIAGAGSGKTRVITRRIAWLVRSGVAPWQILALTFTNKAADEMRRRVEGLVGDGGVNVTTFHSWSARMLRRHIGAIGMDTNFTIYDRSDQLRLAKRVLRQTSRDDVAFKPGALIEHIGHWKNNVRTPEQAVSEARGYDERAMASGYQLYQKLLADANALDFSDLLLRAIDVLATDPAVLAHYQERYHYVLVDEYQDTNTPQHVIAKAMQGKHHNIMAVGDPDQTIYTWRGACMENLMEFDKEFPGAHTVLLDRNYRSSANILAASDSVIRHNRYRHEKTLWTKAPEGDPVRVQHFGDSYDEARWVGKRIEQEINNGAPAGEIAVFYRTKQQSTLVEGELLRRGVNYIVYDNARILDRRGVKDMRSYLQLLVNPRDDMAFLRVVNAPRRGIGARSVERIQAAAARAGRSMLQACAEPDKISGLGPRARKSVAAFHKLIVEMRDWGLEGPVQELCSELAKRLDYVASQPVEDQEAMKETLDNWFIYAAQYDKITPEPSLLDFLERAAIASDADQQERSDCVSLMTLHAAKGLEFDLVFLIGVADEILPHARAVQEGRQEALEEERRLFYVGMTRARRKLFLSHPDYFIGAGQQRRLLVSPFLGELPDDGVEHEWPGRGSGRKARPAEAISWPFPVSAPAEAGPTYRLRKKISLTILDGDDGTLLAEGVKVSHPMFGAGSIIEIGDLGKRLTIKVNFETKGTMTLLLAAEDVTT